MPKYLFQASYTSEGAKGLQKDTASGRQAAVKAAVKAAGGKLESMYYCFGESDVACIMDMPDNTVAAGLSVAVASTGLVRGKITPLLTVDEMDKALSKKSKYQGPGSAK